MTITVLDNMEYGSDVAAQAAYVSNAYAGEFVIVGSKTVITFKQPGIFAIPSGISLSADVLIVGGGGAGGTWCGGGGGAGGVVYETGRALSAGTFTVTVGNGGAQPTANGAGASGGNSVFDGITAYGGGGGDAYSSSPGNGGSGGGAHGGGNIYNTLGGTGVAGQGHSGGSAGSYGQPGGAGGGGAGESGYNSVGDNGGNGGNGISCSITGSATYYGGGGGGWSNTTLIATGGLGGGGNGSADSTSQATPGIANTGGGGGGAWYANYNYFGKAGGSGVVIISFDTEDYDYNGSLNSFSEPSIILEGSYSLKAIAAQTTSLNKTLTRTITTPINLTGHAYIIGKIRASRTGPNIKIGFHDSGGTTTEITPNITTTDTWQNIQLDISSVADANKDAIDQIIITITNADADNTFYLDNFFAVTSTTITLDEMEYSYNELIQATYLPDTITGVDSYTKLLIHADGTNGQTTFTDSSAGAKTITTYGNARVLDGNPVFTVYGNAVLSSTQYKFGSTSGYFDGTGDYLTVPDSDNWYFGTGDFTIEYWVRFSALPSTNSGAYLLNQRIDSSNTMEFLFNNASGTYTWVFNVYSSGTQLIAVSKTDTLTTGTWYHVAIVRYGNNFYLFRDGIQKGTTVLSANSIPNFSTFISIAKWSGGEGNYFNGYMDEIRISKGIARWTENFTPPTAPYETDSYTKLLCHFEGVNNSQGFTDSSITGTKFSQCAYFDGSGDYITVPDSDDWYIGTGDFCFDCWFNLFSNTTSGYIRYIYNQVTDDNNRYLFGIRNNSGTTAIQFTVINSGTAVDKIENISISTYTWYHLAIVRSNGSLAFYLNGVRVGSATSFTNNIGNYTGAACIGSRMAVDTYSYFHGCIDEFRFTKGHPRWTSNFTPPTEPYTTGTQTVTVYSQGQSWLSGWSYRKSFTISRASGAVTNYQMKLTVDSCNGHCLETFNDLRFTKGDGLTLLDYWIESITGGVATVWIEFDSIGTTDTYFFMYYGNSGAAAVSSGVNTFPFFDDFDDSSINTTKWTDLGGTVESNGIVVATATDNTEKGLKGNTAFGTNYALRVRVKPAHVWDTTHLERVCFYGVSDDQQDSIIFCHVSSDFNSKYTTYTGASTFTNVSLPGLSPETWYTCDIVRNGSTNALFAVEGLTPGTISTTLPTGSLVPKIGAYANGSSISADWILVRQYIETEPTLSTFSSEVAYAGSDWASVPVGSYAFKGIATATGAVTRTITTPIALTGTGYIYGRIRSSRTGSNIKVGFHLTNGTTLEVTPDVASADTWQQFSYNAVNQSSYVDKIIITVVNADADTTFYLDNFYAVMAPDMVMQVSKTVAYAVLNPIAAGMNVSKLVAYAVLGPFEDDLEPMLWIYI